jgi:hypothetical protein
MTTKLDRFLREHQITTKALIKESRRHDPRQLGYSRNHVYSIRRGESEPTRACMAVILAAVRAISGKRDLQIGDLFEFGEGRRKAS